MENYQELVIKDWSTGGDTESGKFGIAQTSARHIKNFVPARNDKGYTLKLRNGWKQIGGYCTSKPVYTGYFDAWAATKYTLYCSNNARFAPFIYSEKRNCYTRTGMDYLFQYGKFTAGDATEYHQGIGMTAIKDGVVYSPGCSGGNVRGVHIGYNWDAPSKFFILNNHLISVDNRWREGWFCHNEGYWNTVKKSFRATIDNATCSLVYTWHSGCYNVAPTVCGLFDRNTRMFHMPANPHVMTTHRGRIFMSPYTSQTVYYSSVQDGCTNPRFTYWNPGSPTTQADGNWMQVTREDSYVTNMISTEAGLIIFCNDRMYLWSWPEDTGPSDTLGGANINKLFDIGTINENSAESNGILTFFLSREAGVGISLYILNPDMSIKRITGRGYDIVKDLSDDTMLFSADNSIFLVDKPNNLIYQYSILDDSFFEIEFDSAIPNFKDYLLSSDNSSDVYLVGTECTSHHPYIVKIPKCWSSNVDIIHNGCSYPIVGHICYDYMDFGEPYADKYLRQVIVGTGPYSKLDLRLSIHNKNGYHACTRCYSATNLATQDRTVFDIGERVVESAVTLRLTAASGATSDTGIDFIEFRYRPRKQ